MENNINVYEIRVKVFLLQEIPLNLLQSGITDFIDSAMGEEEAFLNLHEANCFKGYSLSLFYPVEKDKLYKKEGIYTITIRTVDIKLARFFSETLNNHNTPYMKGLTAENRVLPKKTIGEIYSLTSTIVKTENGYWKNVMSLKEYERRLFENAVKKYNQFTESKIDEDFQLYTNIEFLNKKPVGVQYKGIKLLGDKINLKVADNPRAQELAYFLLGAGLCELNSRGFGFCNYRWI